MFQQGMPQLSVAKRLGGADKFLRVRAGQPGLWMTATSALRTMLGWSIASLALLALPSLAVGLNDTGITDCKDAAGNTTSCADFSSFPRQDARYGRDPQAAASQLPKIGAGSKGFDYSKIASDGSLLSAGAASWSCTKDNVTGLTWEVKTVGGLRDKNATFTWYKSIGNVGVQSGGSCQSAGRCDTEKYVADLNATGLCGANDWRLPTVKELEGLADFGRVNQALNIDTQYFPNTVGDLYWTSVPDSSTGGQYAWSTDFADGSAHRNQLSTAMRVRLVRGAATTSQLSLTDGGLTVTDANTGLVWKRKYEMVDPNNPGAWGTRIDTFDWSTALRRAVADRTAGHSDWRLPNVKELRSLMDETVDHPALNTSFFSPPLLSSWFLTSSPTFDYSWFPMVWAVNSDFGHPLGLPVGQSEFVRLVRGGGSFDNLVSSAPQSIGPISFSPTTLAVGMTSTASATATSNLAVIFTSVTPSVCTVSGSTVTGVSAGTCTVAANQPGNASYAAALQVTQNIVVGKGSQTLGPISFNPAVLTVGGTTSIVGGTASSGLPVTFTSSTPAICTVGGSTVTGVAMGACTVVANQAGNTNYFAALTVTQNINVQSAQTIGPISFLPATLAVGGTTTASATASSGLAVTFTSSTPLICTVSGSTVTGVAVGTCTVLANQAGNASYVAAAQVTQAIAVNPGSQSIGAMTFSTVLAVGGTTTVSAAASSGLPVSFTSATPVVCTVSGSTVTGVSAGTCTVAANQPGDANYLAASPVAQNVVVGKGSQTLGPISFNPAVLTVGGTTSIVGGTASSGLPVTFTSSTPAICTVGGSTVTGVAMGACTVVSNQAGNANYFAALAVTQNINVQSAQTIGPISFLPATLAVGGTTTASATATSGLPVSFSTNTPAICTVGGSTVTGLAAGTCSVTANQAGNASYVAAAPVNQATAVSLGSQSIGAITFSTVLAVGGTTTVSATASSGLPVSFTSTTPGVCTVSGSAVTGVSAGTCTLAANQGGNPNYAAAPQVTQNFSVYSTQTIGPISFAPSGPLMVGGSTTASATATSGLGVSFSSAPLSVCTVSGSTVTGVGAGTCTVVANQAGNGSYAAAPPVAQNVVIIPIPQTIGPIIFSPATLAVGGTTAASATATPSGLPVAFTSSTPAICTVSGGTVTGIAIGTCTVAANQAGNSSYAAAPQVTQTIAVSQGSQTIGSISFTPPTLAVGGTTAASATATSGLPVSFSTNTPAICTVSGSTVTGAAVGTCTVLANQAGNASYAAAPQVTQILAVTSASSNLSNISTRGQVQTGDNVMIGGFVISGATAKQVLIRARGPSLAALGVLGVLANPTVSLYSGQTVIASNDNWGSAANAAAITATGFAPTNGWESAILTTLNPGAYTAIVSGVGGTSGVGIVEVLEIDHPESPLSNISTRGQVQTGDNVMIGGFVISGATAKQVLIRARGPSLAALGVLGVLANPTVSLYSGPTVIASNDNWGSAANAAAITATGSAPTNGWESAILTTLNPGPYTVIVQGVGGTSGVGIVEVLAQ